MTLFKRWWRWLFTPQTPKVEKQYKRHYTGEQWATLAACGPTDLRRLAREWGRTRNAIYEAWRKAQRSKEKEYNA